jgi:hypothetical protein
MAALHRPLGRFLTGIGVATLGLVAFTHCTSKSSNTITVLEPDAGAGGMNGASGGEGDGASENAGAAGEGSPGTAGSGNGNGGEGNGCESTAAFQLSEGPGRATEPYVVWTGDGYGVAWQDDRDGNTEIYFARLDAEGNKIGDDVRVTNDPGESVTPVLAWASSEFNLVWSDDRDGNTEIYFVRLGPAGSELADEVRVTDDVARSEFPAMVRSGGGIGLVWNDTRDDDIFQVYAAFLGGQGQKLTTDHRVSTGDVLSASPVVAMGESGAGVAWHDLRDGEGLQIYFARTDTTGVLVGEELRLSDEPGGTPSIAVNGSTFAIAWASSPGSGGEVYSVLVDESGAVNGQPVPLSSSDSTAGFPAIIARDDGYAVVWPDGRDGDREVYLAELDADGIKLDDEIQISDDATSSTDAVVAESPLGYGVAWVDDATDTTGEIMFRAVCR